MFIEEYLPSISVRLERCPIYSIFLVCKFFNIFIDFHLGEKKNVCHLGENRFYLGENRFHLVENRFYLGEHCFNQGKSGKQFSCRRKHVMLAASFSFLWAE